MDFNKLKIEEFYNTDFVDSASYDNLRKIASYIDGFKNSSRKIIHTVLDKNINKKTKVSILQSSVSEYTEYLHGENNLGQVIINLAQNFTGSNNIPLLQRNGEFGSRHANAAAAPRYIKTQKETYLDDLISKLDNDSLVSQRFEDTNIEPRYFVPILPMLIINGSEGVSTGFAQKVLPRDKKVVISELNKVLKGTKKLDNIKMGTPYWEGFKGEVVRDDINPSKWYIKGVAIVENTSTILIEEVPIGYDLKKYLEVLDKLSDSGIIVSYKDMSEDDNFKFKVKVKREVTNKYDTNDKILELFKLIKPITENYTTIDENNRIRVFDNIEDIFKSYFLIRKEYFNKRKSNILSIKNDELSVLNSKYIFIKSVIEGSIVVNNKSKKMIISDIEKNSKIIKVDGGYEYLLRMPIYSLSKEKLSDIKKKVSDIKLDIKELKSKTIETLWLEDIKLI